MMGDRATLERIFAIMRRILLVPMDGVNPIPRKGTTRHECYRALYEIQELLETRRCFGMHLPQTNADRFRAMSDEELAIQLVSEQIMACGALLKGLDNKDLLFAYVEEAKKMKSEMIKEKLDWLKKEVEE